MAQLTLLDAAQYRDAVLKLLPKGAAWTRALASKMANFWHAFGDELARVHARADELLDESPWGTIDETLGDYERMLSLPDPCVVGTPTTEERREIVKGRMRAVAGEVNADYYVAIAAQYGFTIEVQMHRGTVAGSAICGDAICGGHAPRYLWTIVVTAGTGDLSILQCAFDRIQRSDYVLRYDDQRP